MKRLQTTTLVTKYVDDTHWGFLAYDGASSGSTRYKNGTAESWPSLSDLPAVNKEDVLSISTSYKENGLNITVENETTKQSGKAVVNNENVTALKTQSGKIGFGARKIQSGVYRYLFLRRESG